jgi:hypothetical protein
VHAEVAVKSVSGTSNPMMSLLMVLQAVKPSDVEADPVRY